MKNTIYISICFLLLISCSLDPDNFNEIGLSLRQEKEKYPSNLVDHFPDSIKIKITGIDYLDSAIKIKYYSASYLDTTKKDNDSKFLFANYTLFKNIDSLEQIYAKKSKLYGKYTDNCLIVRRAKDIYIDEQFSYIYNNCKDSNYTLAIPLFDTDDRIPDSTLLKDLKDYNYYIFDYGTNHIFKQFIKADTNLPKPFQHGFTKGVAVNKKMKKAIFWIDLW